MWRPCEHRKANISFPRDIKAETSLSELWEIQCWHLMKTFPGFKRKIRLKLKRRRKMNNNGKCIGQSATNVVPNFPCVGKLQVVWKFGWNTLTRVWQERGSSPILPGTKLFHSVATTNISDQPNFAFTENGLNLISSVVWECQQDDIFWCRRKSGMLFFMVHKTNQCSKVLHMGSRSASSCKFDSFQKWVLHFPPEPSLHRERQSLSNIEKKRQLGGGALN